MDFLLYDQSKYNPITCDYSTFKRFKTFKTMSSVAMTFDISAATMARVQDSFGDFGVDLVKLLSEKYGFSAEEAIASIGLEGFKLTTKKGGRKATGEKKEKVPDYLTAQFKHIVSSVDSNSLKSWTAEVVKGLLKEEEREKGKGGFFSWFSSKEEEVKEDSFILSEEE